MAKRAKLTWDRDWYTPSNIKAMIDAGRLKEVRKEYTRLRDISQKRLKRLKAAGYEETEIYQRNYKHYPLLKNIKTNSELAQRLSDLSRFIESRRSTIKGIKDQRTQSIQTLHEHGYDFVNDRNYQDFVRFMESYRDNLLDMEYDSGDAAELFGVAEKHKIEPEKMQNDFEFWLENLDLAKKLRRARKTTGSYSDFYKKTRDKTKRAKK